MSILPSPVKIKCLGEQAELIFLKQIDLSPYHFGLLFEK